MSTNKEFAKYIRSLLDVDSVYCWGGCGYKMSNHRINQLANQYPSHYSANKIVFLRNLIGTDTYMVDCCGMIKTFFMGKIPNVNYKPAYDKDAKGITLGVASSSGTIDTLPEMEGVLLYMPRTLWSLYGKWRCYRMHSKHSIV